MTGFPSQPVAPATFVERYLASRLAAARLPEGLCEIELSLGIKLTGSEGGEWVISLAGGAASLRAGRRSATALSLIQSVADFRGALWEPRGEALRARISAQLPLALLGAASGAPDPDPARVRRALAQLADLDALLRLRITADAAPDWTLDLRLGPGALPAEPASTLCLPLDAAEALAAGRLRPLDALRRIQVDGDYGLLLAAFGALRSATG